MIFKILLIINIIVALIYGLDKYKAIKNKSRISENFLLTIALFGSIGALLGMQIFHHKTKKLKFKILIPLFIFIDIYIYKFLINF